MDWKWCECERRRDHPFQKSTGQIVCALCDGFMVCDACKAQQPKVGDFPLALVAIRGGFYCPQHAWIGAITTDERHDSK